MEVKVGQDGEHIHFDYEVTFPILYLKLNILQTSPPVTASTWCLAKTFLQGFIDRLGLGMEVALRQLLLRDASGKLEGIWLAETSVIVADGLLLVTLVRGRCPGTRVEEDTSISADPSKSHMTAK